MKTKICNPKIYITDKKKTAKSTSISLKPIKITKIDIFKIFDGYPADCLLYSLFHEKHLNILHIFGVNEHNHFGYSNYIGSTTTLLLLAKHFDIPAFSLSSQILIEPTDYQHYLKSINKIRSNDPNTYYSFNINDSNSFEFKKAIISKHYIENYQHFETVRGIYTQITYKQSTEFPEKESDILYQMNNENYYVVIQ